MWKFTLYRKHYCNRDIFSRIINRLNGNWFRCMFSNQLQVLKYNNYRHTCINTHSCGMFTKVFFVQSRLCSNTPHLPSPGRCMFIQHLLHLERKPQFIDALQACEHWNRWSHVIVCRRSIWPVALNIAIMQMQHWVIFYFKHSILQAVNV